MKKSIFKKIGGLFLGLAMIIGISAGISSVNPHGTFAATGETYSKVTDVGSLGSGDTIIIVCEDKNDALSTAQNTNNRGVQAITINNGSTSFVSGVQDIVLSRSSGQWILTAGNIRLSGVSGNNYLKNGTDTWSISISSGNATITSATSGRVIKRNSSSNLYATYSSGQTAVQIYKKDTGSSKTVESIAISEDMTKKSYTTDDEFDPTGLVVTATYSDESTANVTNSTEFSFDPEKPTKGLTNVTVTASYNGKTASKTVSGLTVKQSSKQSTSISTFSATSGWVDTTTKKYVYYEAFQGDGTTAPVVNSSKLRLYKPASGKSTGGFITLTAYENATIKKVIFKSNRDSGNNYRLTTNGTLSSLTKSGSSAPYSYTISDLNTSSIQIVNTYANSNDISYIEVEFELPPAKQLTGITIDSQPTNKNYSVGDTFDTTGMVVKAIYDDESSEEINDYSIVYQGGATATSFAAADTQVTISYEGKTADVTGIDVSNYKGIEVTGITDANRTFTAGDKFSFGGSVRKVYGHSSKADTYVTLTNAELNQCTFTLGGTTVTSNTVLTPSDNGKKVVVTFNGNSTTDSTGSYNLIVNYAEPTGISGISSAYTVGVGDTLTLSPVLEPQGYVDSSIEFDYDDYEITSGDLVDEEDFLFVDGELVVNDGNTHSGEITVKVFPKGYTSLTQEIVITVLGEAAPVLQDIRYEITGSYKATQYTNKTLDISGLTFYAVFDKGDDVDITNAIEWEDEYEVGDHPFGIYADPLDEQNVQEVEVTQITFANDYVDSIEVTGSMTNKSYVVGQSWSAAGLGITGTNASTDSAGTLTATRYEFDPSTPSVGLTQVKVRGVYLNENSTEIKSEYVTISEITVVDVKLTSIAITSNPTNTNYTVGQEFNYSGLVVQGTYNDGHTATLTAGTDYTVSEPNMLVKSPEGGTVVTVSANGVESKTFSITVSPKVVSTAWTKATSLTDGDIITLGIVENGTTKVMSGWEAQTYAPVTDATLSENVITANVPTGESSAPAITELKTIANKNGTYSFTTIIGETTYFVGYQGTSNTLNLITLDKYDPSDHSWKVSFEDDYIKMEDISTVSSEVHRIVVYNITSPRFAAYKDQWNAEKSYYNPVMFKKTVSGSYDVIGLNAEYKKEGTLYAGDKVVVDDFFNATAYYNDGLGEVAVDSSKGLQVDGSDILVEGQTSVTLKLGTKTVTVTIPEVQPQLKHVTDISLVTAQDGQPVEDYYLVEGVTQNWDYRDLNVVISYDDASSETISLAQAITKYGATVSPANPTLNCGGFDVAISVLGYDEELHFDANVVAKAFDGINSFNFKKEDLVLNYFEGDCYNMAGINSITMSYNSGDTLNISKAQFASYGVKVGLIEKTTDKTLAVELTEESLMNPQYDGYYLAVSCDGFVKSTTNKVVITRLIHDITVESGAPTETTTNFSFAGKIFSENNQTITNNGIDFTLYNNGNYYGNDSTKGQQIGSGTYPASEMTLSANVSGKVKSVTVETSGGKSVNANVSVSVGGTSFLTSQSKDSAAITDSNASYTFTGSNNGEIVISWSQSSSKALYFKSITIVYDKVDYVTYSNVDITAQHAVVEFADYVNAQLASICGDAGSGTKALDASQAQGHTYRIDKTWSDIKAKFDSTIGVLDDSVELANGLTQKELAVAMLQNVIGEYDNEKAGAGCVEHAMAIYDHVYTLYGSYVEEFGGNFLSRNISAGSRINPILALNDVDNSVWIISAVALVGLTAIGGYFFYRKRKEI